VAKNSFVASCCTCCRVDSCGSASSASLPIGAAPNCCHYVNGYWKSAPVKVPRHPPPGRPSYLLPGCVHAAGVRWSWSRDSVRRRSHGSSPKRATSLTLHNPYSSSNPLHAPARAPEVCPLTQKRGKTTTIHSAPNSGTHFRRILCPDREHSPRSRPTITPYSESKTRFKTHDGPRPPQTPPASSKRPNQKWPGITAEPFSHFLCRATSDWLLTFLGTNPEAWLLGCLPSARNRWRRPT
jgi:hypothetical protein